MIDILQDWDNRKARGEDLSRPPSIISKFRSNIGDFMRQYGPSERLPASMNVTGGLLSLAGRNPVQQEIYANLPHVLAQDIPTEGERIEQSIGKYAPSALMPETPFGVAGRFSKALNPISRVLSQSAYGAAANPENRAESALNVGSAQAAGELLPPAMKLIGKGINYLQPGKQASRIAEALSGGQNLEDIGKSVAKKIKSAYNAVKEEGKRRYNGFFDNYNLLSTVPIYDQRSVIEGIPKLGQYQQLDFTPKDIPNKYIRELNDKFSRNPTFDNAHKLQSALKAETNLLLKNPHNLTPEEKEWLPTYHEMTDALHNDQNQYLLKQGGEPAVRGYQDVADFWKNNPIAFNSDRTLRKIIHEGEDNPTRSDLMGIFKYPNSSINNVVRNLPADTKNQLTAIGLNIHPQELTPENLLARHIQLQKEGMGSYVSPEISNQLDKLRKQNRVTDIARTLGGGIGGYQVGNLAGAAELGALTGGVLAHQFGNRLPSITSLMNPETQHALTHLLSRAYQSSLPIGAGVVGDQYLGNQQNGY